MIKTTEEVDSEWLKTKRKRSRRTRRKRTRMNK